jgi:hypothetical protein
MDPVLKPANGYAELKEAVAASVRFTSIRAYLFGFLYFSLRTILVVMATCAAAKGILFLQRQVALLSLLVAIGTALDTLYRPQARYRENFLANDRYWALQQEIAGIAPSDAAALKNIRERWTRLNEEYGKSVLPE